MYNKIRNSGPLEINGEKGAQRIHINVMKYLRPPFKSSKQQDNSVIYFLFSHRLLLPCGIIVRNCVIWVMLFLYVLRFLSGLR